MAEEKKFSRIIIIGAGAAGIAAASKLFENKFENITILEAEDRIGGRLFSTKFGEYTIDLGGQWIVGEENNISYELAAPLGLIGHFKDSGLSTTKKLFLSSNTEIPNNINDELFECKMRACRDIPDDLSYLKTGSLGEHIENKFKEYFQTHHKINPNLHNLIIDYMIKAADLAINLYEVPAKLLKEMPVCEGDQDINWKEGSYGMILDLLMKKYPNPDEELPVSKNTVLNKKVTKIDYGKKNKIKITTEDGNEYFAKHIIFTGSIGVLKENHKFSFNPPLPEKEIEIIQTIGMSSVGKIYLYYENPWWSNDIYLHAALWTSEDRQRIEKDPMKRWMLSFCGFWPIEHKPKLISLWLTGPYTYEMEKIPDDTLCTQIVELLKIFFERSYEITEPLMIKRSTWNTNENFRGTYSYLTSQSVEANVSPADLEEPIMDNNKPITLFAGEAVAKYAGTVNGAIDSGRKAADRLIDYYSAKKEFDQSI